jgi:hypothetical protein
MKALPKKEQQRFNAISRNLHNKTFSEPHFMGSKASSSRRTRHQSIAIIQSTDFGFSPRGYRRIERSHIDAFMKGMISMDVAGATREDPGESFP